MIKWKGQEGFPRRACSTLSRRIIETQQDHRDKTVTAPPKD